MKLFASFTGLLRELRAGTVSHNDLATGFFAFGCTREHAANPDRDSTNEVQWFFKKDPDGGCSALEQINHALFNAERDQRVVWTKDHDMRAALQKLATLAGVEIVR